MKEKEKEIIEKHMYAFITCTIIFIIMIIYIIMNPGSTKIGSQYTSELSNDIEVVD